MRMFWRAAMTLAATGALLAGGLGSGGAAVAAERTGVAGPVISATADEWEGPIDQWTTFPFEEGWEICNRTGQIGVAFGAYKAYQCRDNGWWTSYLYVQYYP
ncbi:hypothetical protein ACQEVC_38270 [Plantactinospora sp. CA-294935]|uniref:hypothetical protein n=1 Tax=Plantactinospora sp. CA-294935 TaxID=3240012 RepID=UPI003D8B519B